MFAREHCRQLLEQLESVPVNKRQATQAEEDMHVEIQVALNFLISFLYNKLPRRRVNQFGDELDAALKLKFEGHWYREKPFKGSAFRCLKTAPPLDPVFEIAAREAGMDLVDIQENLPQELSIWIDPGEVSYRMSEKGPVKILYSEHAERAGLGTVHGAHGAECEPPVQATSAGHRGEPAVRTFNPEAQCFRPVEQVIANKFATLSLGGHSPQGIFGGQGVPITSGGPMTPFDTSPPPNFGSNSLSNSQNNNCLSNTILVANAVTPTKPSGNGALMTTAAFAQTKFGSTKLKSNTKRSQRMSPTEFSNYIKQRALQQQQQHQMPPSMHNNPRLSGDGPGMLFGLNSCSPQNSRSISPEQPLLDNFMMSPSVQPSSSGSSLASSVSSSVSSSGSGVAFGASPPFSGRPLGSSSRSPPQFALEPFDDQSFYLTDLLLDTSPTPLGPLSPGPYGRGRGESLGRFVSFLDQAGPYGGASSSSSLSSNSPPAGMPAGELGAPSSAKSTNFTNSNVNMSGVTYQNQYQHLLVAN